jgi:hypothetical protein
LSTQHLEMWAISSKIIEPNSNMKEPLEDQKLQQDILKIWLDSIALKFFDSVCKERHLVLLKVFWDCSGIN